MDDRQKTIAALTIIAGFIVLVIIIVGVLISGKKVISPVPDEGAIKVIFISPTQVPIIPDSTATPEVTLQPAKKTDVTPTKKPTPTTTSVSVTPTKGSTPTPTRATTPTPIQ